MSEEKRGTWRERWKAWKEWVSGVLYGMTFYEFELTFRRQRADLEHLFVLIAFGDLLGIPIIPPYYSLRLLPYVVPMISTWKRRLLREKDLTELAVE